MFGYAVSVIVAAPKGTPLTQDFDRDDPRWKFPGGKSVAGETAEGCAVRQLKKKIGLRISADQLQEIKREDRGDHVRVFYRVDLLTLPELSSEEEYLEIGVFTPLQILAMEDMLEGHYEMAKEVFSPLVR